MHKARACAGLLFLVLPGCIAIGNSGYHRVYPPATKSLLQERVDCASRIVDLRQRRLDEICTQRDAGRSSSVEVTDAEVQLEEARLHLLECRVELRATEPKPKD